MPPILASGETITNIVGKENIIKSLNPTKAHGFDNTSIYMIQLCGDAITPPLIQIVKSQLSQDVSTDTWKMTNIIPVMKRSKIFNKKLQTTKSFANIFQGLSKTLI